MTKSQNLRSIIETPGLDILLEAHNGLTARIAEEAGFRAIWASGLAISASLGVRDANEASWTQMLEITEFINDAVEVPVLFDGDSGHGNFNAVRRMVRKLEQRGIAGVCIEDKKFPKNNSFVEGDHDLVSVDEFCGKIRAGKDSQKDASFVVVARVEAFIAGLGLVEALKRAEAYHAAGADAILIHSRLADAAEIIAFLHEWSRRSPIILVPTTYYQTPLETFESAGVTAVIWANHLLRGAIANMQRIARHIRETRTVTAIEDMIVPIEEVFRLQHDDELRSAENRYLGVGREEHP